MKIVKNLLFLMLAIAAVGCGVEQLPKIETFTEADDPVALTDEQQAAWGRVGKRLNGAWACADSRYSRSIVPEVSTVEVMPIVAWKGERASAQILLWTAEAADGVR